MEENVKLVYVQKTDKRYFKTDPIWQYDVGHVLDLHEFDTLPETFQVHFSHNPSGDAVTQVGQNGACSVPDSFVQVAKTIYAWIYVATEDTGLTKYFIEMPVARKGKPSDQEPEPVEQSVIDQAVAALNAGVDRAEDAADAAEAAQAGAEAAEQGAIAAQQTAQAAARTAADKVTEAAAQVNLAKQEADRAETAAQNAEGSATAAAGFATSAASFAQSATSASQAAAQSARATAQAGAEADRDAKAAAASAATAASEAANAAQSASQAEHTVQDASEQADRAEQAAEDAETARTGAETAQSAAAGSATAAAGSASAAQTSAGNAASSATAAAGSAQAAAQTAAQFEEDITQLKSDIESKQNKPVTPGTEGQVLGLDAQLHPVWVDQTGGGGTVDDSALAPVIKSTASGEIASFADGADNRLIDSLVVNITPVQDLHGQDAPYPPGGGKNKFDGEYPNIASTLKYRAIHIGDGTFTMSSNIPLTPNSNAANIFFLAGNVSTGASTTTNGVYNGQSRTVTAVDGYVTVAYRNADSTNPESYNTQIESGSTATAWSPYENNCPITGWMEANVWDDPKHGGNINFNQLIKNGDFSEGQSYWENQGAGVVTISDGVMEITPAGNYGKRLYVPSNARPTIVPGHIYLFVVEAKKNFSTRITAINANMGNCYYQGYLEKTNEWEIVWNRGTGTPSTGAISYMYFADIGANYVADSGQKIWIRNIRLFDLTQMFGLGKEPTGANFISLLYKGYYPYNTGEVTTVSAVNGEPYRHFQIEFPSEAGTVYGGELTINGDGTGTLVVDLNEMVFDGVTNRLSVASNTYIKSTYTRGYLSLSSSVADANRRGEIVCDFFPVSTNEAINVLRPVMQSYQRLELNFFIAHNLTGIVNGEDTATTATTKMNNWLKNNHVKVLYPLATPLTYTLTAEQISGILSTLKGMNNIWADCGDIESVEYSADTKLYIDNKLAQLAAQIVNS